jgi:hypothetical protein
MSSHAGTHLGQTCYISTEIFFWYSRVITSKVISITGYELLCFYWTKFLVEAKKWLKRVNFKSTGAWNTKIISSLTKHHSGGEHCWWRTGPAPSWTVTALSRNFCGALYETEWLSFERHMLGPHCLVHPATASGQNRLKTECEGLLGHLYAVSAEGLSQGSLWMYYKPQLVLGSGKQLLDVGFHLPGLWFLLLSGIFSQNRGKQTITSTRRGWHVNVIVIVIA